MCNLPLRNRERLANAYRRVQADLLAARHQEGYWEGELSSSALSTATAICALALVDRPRYSRLIDSGARWLIDHQNNDGGWGDTVKSVSNISTAMLCRAALTVARESGGKAGSTEFSQAVQRAEDYLQQLCGGRDAATLVQAIRQRYGKDRTFSVPILTCCALAGLVDWRDVVPLPFELACVPQKLYRLLRLPVVSYALPALIAIGIVRHVQQPTLNPLTRGLRQMLIGPALKRLRAIQPSNGGFLEATPLTSFVAMSLCGAGLADHPVVGRCAGFLVASARTDGSWPIDTNLSTWLTTLAINALGCHESSLVQNGKDSLMEILHGPGSSGSKISGTFAQQTGSTDGRRVLPWLLCQQYRDVHPYTGTDPGGWAWTPLPGGVPDADDTAGALLALHQLGLNESNRRAARAGIRWLLDLQNANGGWPTFCRGWGYLPFDRSGPDLTAHVLRALHCWQGSLQQQPRPQDVPQGKALSRRIRLALRKGIDYLGRTQQADGFWVPLWFGNQFAPNEQNPTYGTARVLLAYRDLGLLHDTAAQRGIEWLLTTQRSEGGWGGAPGAPASVEETALAVEALATKPVVAGQAEALACGLDWLAERVEQDTLGEPSPIGFYFAKLWYFEKLYPLIFTAGALSQALRVDKQRQPILAH